jgi:uncharacterized caspase-like protein
MKRVVCTIAFTLGLLTWLIWPGSSPATLTFDEFSPATSARSVVPGKRVALVVGNSAYQHAPALSNPARDASAMAAMFQKSGFAVLTAQNDVGNLQFKRTIRQFEDAAADADIAVIYYAGHGIDIHGVNYLIPVDAKLASDRDADDEAVTLDRLIEAADGAKRLRLVILDACRDNPFIRRMKRQRIQTRGLTAGLSKVEPTGANTLIAFGAKVGTPAEDADADHSPFTAALLDNLFVPGLDVRLALGRVRDEVLTKTNNRQEPYVYGSLGGASISVAPSPDPQRDSLAARAVSVGEKGDYELVEKIGTKGAWEIFLAQHPRGFYAELARQQLARLGTAVQDNRKETQSENSINIEMREVAQPINSALKLALVIGNATYAGEKPPTASVTDVHALMDELRRRGFHVTVAANANKEQMRSAVESFKNIIKPGATAVIFFSGYAIQAGKQSYLIPIDARIQTEDQVRADGFSIESILKDIHSAGATKKVVVMDAARANPFESRFRGSPAGLAPLNAPPGTLAIYSASPDKIVSDNNLFVSELLKQIQEPGLTAEEIFDYTRINVARASKREQVPRVWNTLNKDFFFAAPSKVATRDLAAPPAQATELPKVTGPIAQPTRPLPPNTLLWWWPQWHR